MRDFRSHPAPVAGNCGFTIAPTRTEHHDVIVRTLENVEDMDPATLSAGVVWEFGEDLETRFRAYIANDDAEEVGRLLTHEHVALGLSDAGAHVDQLCDAPLPTDLLGSWVRDRDVMPLEQAVRKLTGEPADMFGFARRGYLREGYWADVCVFDPQTVAPGPTRRVRDFPADGERLTAEEPIGVRHVLVNGTPIRLDGEQLDSPELRPGMHPEIA